MPWNLDIEHYRQEAERCRANAAAAREPAERAHWVAVAEEFDALIIAVERLRGIATPAGRPQPGSARDR